MAGWMVGQFGQSVEGDFADPLVVVSPARAGYQAVALLANRDSSGGAIRDVSIDIGVDQVDRGRMPIT